MVHEHERRLSCEPRMVSIADYSSVSDGRVLRRARVGVHISEERYRNRSEGAPPLGNACMWATTSSEEGGARQRPNAESRKDRKPSSFFRGRTRGRVEERLKAHRTR
jgi:hypothetical protein